MTELLAVVGPILLVDVLNPVLLAALIFTAGSARPVLNSGAMLLGHTLAYLGVGLVVFHAMDALAHRFHNPEPVDFLFEFLVGLGCLYAALASRGGQASEARNPEGALTPGVCLLYGGVINLIGAPFAVPYFAVISQILEADLAPGTSLAVLLGYNLAYAVPFALVPASIALVGQRARPLLEKVNGWMVKGADLLMPWMLLAIGLFLLADVANYLLTGEPLPLD